MLHLLLDVNECDTGMDSCDSNTAVCINTPGGFNCRCKAGFQGDGMDCAGMSCDSCD